MSWGNWKACQNHLIKKWQENTYIFQQVLCSFMLIVLCVMARTFLEMGKIERGGYTSSEKLLSERCSKLCDNVCDVQASYLGEAGCLLSWILCGMTASAIFKNCCATSTCLIHTALTICFLRQRWKCICWMIQVYPVHEKKWTAATHYLTS